MSETFSFSRSHESSCLVWSITLRSEMKRMLFSLATAKVDLAKVSGAVVSLTEKELFHREKMETLICVPKIEYIYFSMTFSCFSCEKWFSVQHCVLFFIYFVTFSFLGFSFPYKALSLSVCVCNRARPSLILTRVFFFHHCWSFINCIAKVSFLCISIKRIKKKLTKRKVIFILNKNY